MAHNITAQKLGSSNRMPRAGDWKPEEFAETAISKPILETLLRRLGLDRLLP